MAPRKRQVKARRHLVCDHSHISVDTTIIWMRKVMDRDSGGWAYFPAHGVLESGRPNSRVI